MFASRHVLKQNFNIQITVFQYKNQKSYGFPTESYLKFICE